MAGEKHCGCGDGCVSIGHLDGLYDIGCPTCFEHGYEVKSSMKGASYYRGKAKVLYPVLEDDVLHMTVFGPESEKYKCPTEIQECVVKRKNMEAITGIQSA